ncbi:hypothetical protein BBFGKLBO_01814 [Synechococcus sp. CBW1107]|nr:hypothetical protein BBFGKLBO_01814 [Synechococcus sp. CBW1107]
MQQIHAVDDQGHLRQQFADHWRLSVVGIDQYVQVECVCNWV